MTAPIAIVGAGFAGAVLARELVEKGPYQVHIFDQRSHVAGNCHTQRDPTTGIMVHEYGPHIFNTSREEVWNYLGRWDTLMPYINRVKAHTTRGVFSLPINLLTLNQFFHQRFNPAQAQQFLASLGDTSITVPKNFEEQALHFLGRELYENFFYGYTKKQWGVEPKELPASILKRLPIRFNYDDNYYNQKFQGIPLHGYTSIVEKILDHPRIRVYLKRRFLAEERKNYSHTFWSGPMDAYFNYRLGDLAYRTLNFERHLGVGDYQGNAVINYCEEEVPYSRIAEHKHFTPWEQHEQTLYFKEYSSLSRRQDIPYYPLRLQKDKDLLNDYVSLAKAEEGITFIGRLGTYRYLDMHVVIGESLDLGAICLTQSRDKWPRFSVQP